MARKLVTRKLTIFTPLREAARGEQTRTGRVYKGVTLIKSGIGNQRDKNYYPADVLESAVETGLFEGLRAFADHPDSVSEEIQPERTIRDLVGVYESATFDHDTQSVRADLRVFNSQRWLSDTIDELIDMGHPELIGLSINGRGQTEPTRRVLEESGGEETEVNELKRFLELRSTDVVTEAGAGGGFSQLLESARRAKENSTMGRKQLLAAIKEAASKGDEAKVLELSTQLAEVGTEDKTQPGKPVKEDATKLRGKKKAPVEAAADTDVDDTDVDDTDDADGDEAALDAAVSEATDGASDAVDADEGDDTDAEGDDTDDADGDDLDEAAIHGMTGKGGTVAAGPGKFTKADKYGSKSRFTTRPAGAKAPKKVLGSGGKMVESAAADVTKDQIIARLQRKNVRLSEALRILQSANTARTMLRESKLPVDVRVALVDDLIGLTPEEMKREISKQTRLFEAVVRSAKGAGVDEYDEVEGAGSRIRESHGGSRGGDEGADLDAIFEESGLALKG